MSLRQGGGQRYAPNLVAHLQTNKFQGALRFHLAFCVLFGNPPSEEAIAELHMPDMPLTQDVVRLLSDGGKGGAYQNKLIQLNRRTSHFVFPFVVCVMLNCSERFWYRPEAPK